MRIHAATPGMTGWLAALLALASCGVLRAEEEDHEEGGQRVSLSAAERAEFGIQVAAAAPGELRVRVDTPGEVLVNPDRVAHISPRVPGVAVETFANVGDRVRQDQVLAVLHSRELSELKSAYLVARERLELARTTFDREKSLWDQSISSERLFLEAKNGLAEARIELQAGRAEAADPGLFRRPTWMKLSFEDGERFTRYVMSAPIQGTVIRKHIVRGEVLQEDSEAFVVADLRSVWVMLTAYQKDLPFLRVGQSVHVEAGQGGPSTTASRGLHQPHRGRGHPDRLGAGGAGQRGRPLAARVLRHGDDLGGLGRGGSQGARVGRPDHGAPSPSSFSTPSRVSNRGPSGSAAPTAPTPRSSPGWRWDSRTSPGAPSS